MSEEITAKLTGARAGGLYFTAMTCIFVIISFIGQTILTAAGCTGVLYYFISSLFSIISMFTVITAVNFARHEKLSLGRYMRKCSPKYAGYSVLFAAGMFLGLGFVNALAARLVISLGGRVNGIELPVESPFALILFLFCYAFLPAIEEEAFFRGLITESLSRAKIVPAAFCSAAAFALYHGSLTQLLYQFIYGVGLFFIAKKSGSALPGAIAHFINNAAVLVFSYVGIEIDLFNPFIIAGGVILLAAFVWLIARDKSDIKTEPAEKNEVSRFFVPFGAIGTAVFVVTMIANALQGAV